MDILKVNDIPFPVLLSCDTPVFDILLRDAMSTSSTAISDNDEEARPSGTGCDDNRAPGVIGWSVDTNFQKEQMTYPTLEPARWTLAMKEGVVIDT